MLRNKILMAIVRHVVTWLGGLGVVVSDDWVVTTIGVLASLIGVGFEIVRARRDS